MNKIVAVTAAAAVPVALPSIGSGMTPDPIFAALESFRIAEANFRADSSGDIPDEVGDQWTRAVDNVIRTRPTTPAGLCALTGFAREMTRRAGNDATFADRQWLPVMAAIDDATRGMAGLAPWSPPSARGASSDQELVAAVAGMISADDEIQRLHKTYGDDADSRADYAGYEDERYEHIKTLMVVPATGYRGLLAKARALKQRQLQEGDEYGDVAISLADDLVDIGAGAISVRPVTQDSQSEAAILAEQCQKGDRLWGVLSSKIDKIENAAAAKLGARRPSPLIEWRNYSAIGASEIERARDCFLREGIPAHVVKAEYRAAKKRVRDMERAGEEWDEKAGLTDLRLEYEECRSKTRAAWLALGKVHLTSVQDAIAIIGVLRKRMHTFKDLSDDWEVSAFMNASRFLVRVAA